MKIFILIVIIHWIADFILQDEKWALGKRKSVIPLIKHTITYSLAWFVPVYIITGNFVNSLIFVAITLIFHTITDYFTSKIVGKKFDNGHYGSSIPNTGGFSMIGLDQVFHYIQLILTWHFLFGIN